MSQRFAANQSLQLLQSIALESSDGDYSDFKPDELNIVIAIIQNEEDSSDSDDEYTDKDHQLTQMMVRVLKAAVIIMKKLFFEQRQRSVSSQATAGRLQKHNIVRIRAGSTSYSTSSIIC